MRNVVQKILRWEWVFLLLLLPLFLFPQEYRGFVLLVIPSIWLLRKLTLGYFIPLTPYNSAILILLGMIGLSLLVTFDMSLSLPKISGLLIGIALFYATINFSQERPLWPIVAVYICMGVLMALIGLAGSNWQPPFGYLNQIGDISRLFAAGVPGTSDGLINTNELAGVLCWIVPLMFAISIGLRRRLWHKNKALYIALLVSTFFTIFLIIATTSRGGIFAFGASIVLVSAMFVSGRWRLVLAIGFIIVLMILVSYITKITNQDIVGDALGLSGRIEIWSRAILAIDDHPITGVSINGFRRVIHVLYPLFGISPEIDLGHAHNHLLQVALDLGILGLISYLAVWLISTALLWATFRNLVHRRAQHHPYYTLVAGLSGSLLAGWIFGIFDAVALGSRPSFMWWILIGLTASVHYAVIYSGTPLRIYHRSTSPPVQEGDWMQATSPAVLLTIQKEA